MTGRTGDGGIDGKGLLKMGSLLGFRVMFQCKRHRGSIGSKEIRDFRGAFIGKADKGLFITTGRFTGDAIKEAQRDGAPTVDLVDGELLMNKLKEYMESEYNARSFLIELYNSKNTSHLGYFISLSIGVFGLLLSPQSNDIFGDTFQIKLIIISLCALPPYIYLFYKLRYWSAYTNLIFYVIIDTTKPNILLQLKNGCDNIIENRCFFGLKGKWIRSTVFKLMMFFLMFLFYYVSITYFKISLF